MGELMYFKVGGKSRFESEDIPEKIGKLKNL